jgi:hypothetical protein
MCWIVNVHHPDFFARACLWALVVELPAGPEIVAWLVVPCATRAGDVLAPRRRPVRRRRPLSRPAAAAA